MSLKCREEHRTKEEETNKSKNCETRSQSSIDNSENGSTLSENTSSTESDSSFCMSSDDEMEDKTYSNGKERHGSYEMASHIVIDLPEGDTGRLQDSQSASSPYVVIFWFDISHYKSSSQYMILAVCLVSFTLCYGLLQEFVSVSLMQRQLALFIATIQLASSTFWSCLFSKRCIAPQSNSKVPWHIYFVLSLLRAVDLGMTNLSMQFINYPTKTLLKSSRVVFTIITGIVFGRKKYHFLDYVTASLIVLGLAMFLHADSTVAVVFHPAGITFLMISLTCNGIINNWSEVAMNKYNVGQDQFLSRLNFIALFVMLIAAHVQGELITGIRFLTTSQPLKHTPHSTSFTPICKIIILILFSTTGYVGASCAAAMAKRFGALVASITGTGRKAMTLFLSYAVFHNECTLEHIGGILTFLSGLLFKSVNSIFNKALLNSGLYWRNRKEKSDIANKFTKSELICSSSAATI